MGKSVVTAERLYSSAESLSAREERFMINGVEKARIHTAFFKDNVSTNIRFSVTLDQSVNPKNPLIRANGNVIYDTFNHFSYAKFEWGKGVDARGFIARSRGGSLKLESIGSMFTKKSVPFDKDQIFSVDPTMSVAVPNLDQGESWTFNSYLNIFTKLVDQPVDAFFEDDLILIAKAVRWEYIKLPNSYKKKYAMRVEVHTFTTNKIHIFTSWVTRDGLVLRSIIKFHDYEIVKEIVLKKPGD